MKRRYFLKKAGLAFVAAPILGQVIKAKVVPNDPYFVPEKYLFDDQLGITQCKEQEKKSEESYGSTESLPMQESGSSRVFTSLERQTTYLQKHFAKHTEWQVYGFRDDDKWSTLVSKMTVRQSSNHSVINALGWRVNYNLYVE